MRTLEHEATEKQLAQTEPISCGHFSCSRSVSNTEWSARSVRERLRVLRKARHLLVEQASAFADAISPALARTKADTLGSEVLPLLDACKFLERNATKILATRRLGSSGRPLWLWGVQAEVHREPLGHVVIIGPSNFPLLLAGVQALQALVAGNTVIWKPGIGGAAVAAIFARALQQAGLPAGALTVTDESIEAAHWALADSPDKVVFTGSSRSGQAVLSTLAKTATPAVAELSGADAVIVLPDADLNVTAKAIAFGLRLNGAAVCMSPRRLFATTATMNALRPLLQTELDKAPAVALPANTASQLRTLVDAAVLEGATLSGEVTPDQQRPLLIDNATPTMNIARSDIFAPVLSLMPVDSMLQLPEMYAQCDYALTLAIFCGSAEMKKARMIGQMLKAGTVLINDLIAPTVDPRVPFGGRGASGYGVTRGAEGLLEMTAVKTVLVRRGGAMMHLDPTTEADTPLFAGFIRALHGRSWSERWDGLLQAAKAAKGRH